MYDRSLIDALLAHANIVDVVSYYLPGQVIKKGKHYVARCPFHDDHDPSMNVNTDMQIYKCFSCGAGGNAIRFVQEYEKVSFWEAVRKVADIVGFKDPRLLSEIPSVKIDPEKQKLYDCMNDLQSYYRYSLSTAEGTIARDYLKERNIDDATAEEFGIGYAPRDGQKTVEFLLSKKHSLKTIEDIGIATPVAGQTKDRNAGRLTFPLHDANGQVIGYSARQLVKDDSSGKYVNSPETALFHKGNVLYNYHAASLTAHRDGYCFVLEGFMDVIALRKVGITSAVALMGTALTPQQAAMLKKLHAEIRLCLDGDNAGQIGMMRGVRKLAKAGVAYRVVDYGGDLRDPDDILQEEGEEALRQKMSHLIDVVDFELSYYQNVKRISTQADKQAVVRHFAPLLAKEDELTRENHLAKLAKALDYEISALRMFVARFETSDSSPHSSATFITEKERRFVPSRPMMKRLTNRLANAEDTILYYLLSDSGARDYVSDKGNPLFSPEERDLAYHIVEYGKGKETIDSNGLLAYLDQMTNPRPDFDPVARLIEIKQRRSVAAIPYSSATMDQCVEIIEQEKKKKGEGRVAEKALESGDSSAALEAITSRARERGASWSKKKR